MSEADVRRGEMSESSMTKMESKETFGSDSTKYECYVQCMNDPWDLKGEFTCASVCGI